MVQKGPKHVGVVKENKKIYILNKHCNSLWFNKKVHLLVEHSVILIMNFNITITSTSSPKVSSFPSVLVTKSCTNFSQLTNSCRTNIQELYSENKWFFIVCVCCFQKTLDCNSWHLHWNRPADIPLSITYLFAAHGQCLQTNHTHPNGFLGSRPNLPDRLPVIIHVTNNRHKLAQEMRVLPTEINSLVKVWLPTELN